MSESDRGAGRAALDHFSAASGSAGISSPEALLRRLSHVEYAECTILRHILNKLVTDPAPGPFHNALWHTLPPAFVQRPVYWALLSKISFVLQVRLIILCD